MREFEWFLVILEAVIIIVLSILLLTQHESTSLETQQNVNITHLQTKEMVYGSGFDMFDHILYINLDKRTDRRWQIENELIKMGVTKNRMTRISGVIDKFGSLGCSKAHLVALELFETNTNWKNVLIVEDDAIFCQSRDYIDSILSQFCSLHIKWDVLQLFANVQHFEETQFEFLVRLKESQTTAGYAVNRSYLTLLKNNIQEGIDKLQTYNVSNGDFCIDQYWKPLQLTGNWFTFHPIFGYQRDGFSDIEQRTTNYTDKNPLLTKFVDTKFIIAVKTHFSNLHKNTQQLETLFHLQKLGIEFFHYWGDENLESDFEFDSTARVLVVRAKDDYLNLCHKFGKMARFVNTVLNIKTEIKGVFFTDDDIVLKETDFLQFLNDNANINYWGKKVHVTSKFTNHIQRKCNENTIIATLVDSFYPAVRFFPFSIFPNIDYCPGGGFYLSRETIPKLTQRDELFLPFPSPDQLKFHKNGDVFENVCVIDDMNVGEALRVFQIFPEDRDISKIVFWDGLQI
jgi:glycosyl transferase family 25